MRKKPGGLCDWNRAGKRETGRDDVRSYNHYEDISFNSEAGHWKVLSVKTDMFRTVLKASLWLLW